jgi:MerR family transcriptional regulator, copper efflux regulator
MRISAAAQQLGLSPRMLRYREALGLLPTTRELPAPPAAVGPGHRQFDADDLAVAALALELERRLDVSPAELSFGIRVLAEPTVRAQVAGLARQLGRIPAPPGRALDFEQERALRLLGRPAPPRRPPPPR